MRQRLIFWVNFSHVFLKWFFNIAYFILAAIVLWGLWKVTPPCFFAIIDLIKLMMTFEVLPFLIFVSIILVRVLAVCGSLSVVIYGFWRFQILRKCGIMMGSSLIAVSPPFIVIGNLFIIPFKLAVNTWFNSVKFVQMFYEQNCPPITIITGDDEIIANELDEAE